MFVNILTYFCVTSTSAELSKMFQNIASIDRQMKRIEKTSHEKCIENCSSNRNIKKTGSNAHKHVSNMYNVFRNTYF